MKHEIITDTEQLTKAAKPLEFLTENGAETTEGEAIIHQIKAAITKNNLRALAAPQIGIDARIFCIKFDDAIKTFINPIVTKKSGGKIAAETCTSMPGKEILISRPEEITVVYYNDEFKYEDNKLMGEAARIFDQMAQLLDGILPSELGLVSDIVTDGPFSNLSEEEMAEACEIYRQFIGTKAANARKFETEEEQKQFNQLKVAEDVINGRTLIISDEETRQAKGFKQTSQMIKNQNKKAKSKVEFNTYIKTMK